MTRRTFSVAVIWLVTLGLLLSAAVGFGSQAQGRATGLVLMRDDHSQFPQITLDARVQGLDGASVSGLSADDFRVYENGQERVVDAAAERRSGIQLGVILDLAGSIDKAGASGRPVRDEVVEVVQQLFQAPSPLDFDGRSDQVTLIVPTGEESFDVREDWGNDYGRLYNAAYAHLDTTPPAYTPLYSMLVSAMAKMKELPGYEHTPKYVVVVSDGVDRTSVEHVSDVINRADALDVQILGIKVGPTNLGDAENLRRMARMTNGVMQAYTGPGSVDQVWQALGNRRLYYELGYRSGIAQSGLQSLRVSVISGGIPLESNPIEVNLDLRPPSVTITAPEDDLIIDRVADTWDQDPAAIEPQSVPVGVRVEFPDGRVRGIESLTYLMNGAIMATLSPEESYVWDLRDLPSGTYTFHVQARDEWGLLGESRPVSVRLNLKIPPEPPIYIITNYLLAGGVLVLAVAVIYLWVKRPQVVRKVTKAVGDTIAQTLLGRGRTPQARAYLVRLDGGGGEIKRHPVVRQALNMGRSGSRADLVFEEPTVSGLHAQLTEETDGVFCLRDEGSTNGTYVNLEPVSAAGVRLKSGDTIHLGPDVILRFEQDGDGTVPEMEPGAMEDGIDKTQIDAVRPWNPDDDGWQGDHS